MSLGNSDFPATFISRTDADKLLNYIDTAASPTVAMDGFISHSFSESAKDIVSHFSSLGPNGDPTILKPDLSAPGQQIVSAAVSNDVETPNLGYLEFDGTSMATPMVAGAAAIIKQQWPDLSGKQIKNLLVNGTDGNIRTQAGELASGFATGSGRLNIENSLKLGAITQNTSQVLSDCGIRCSAVESLLSLTDTTETWSAELTFDDDAVNGVVSPNEIILAGLASAKYAVDFTLPVNASQDWYHAWVTWSNTKGQTIRQAYVIENNNDNSDLLSVVVSEGETSRTVHIQSFNISSEQDLTISADIFGDVEFEITSLIFFIEGSVNTSAIDSKSLSTNINVQSANIEVSSTDLPFDIDLNQQVNKTKVSCRSGCDDFLSVIDVEFQYMGQQYSTITLADNGVAIPGTSSVAAGDLASNMTLPQSSAPTLLSPHFG
jgi:hypothetical protein